MSNRILRYPEILPDSYVSFQAQKPESTKNKTPGPTDAPMILLYLPKTPNVIQGQIYGQRSGALNQALGATLGVGFNAVESAITNGGDVGNLAEQLRSETMSNGSPILREVAADVAGSLSGTTGSMFLANSQGRIVNPSIELLYSGPSLRSYVLQFVFAPQTQREAEQVRKIVSGFKKFSSPQDEGQDAGMLGIPYEWDVHFWHKGKESEEYQKFGISFLESVGYQQNNGSPMHLPGGEPVISTLNLGFKEKFIKVASDFSDDQI